VTLANIQIEKCANTQHWLDNQLARQAEKPKNINPVITSAEMNKRREDVVYTCAAIMNRPKPKAKVETPPTGQQTPKEEPKKKEDDKMDVEEEGGATVEEMDVD
jgi:heat shock protein 4